MSDPFLQHAEQLKAGFLKRQHLLFIDGKWTAPRASERTSVIDPSTGETLTSIAKMHKVTVEELQKFNHIENDRKLQIGQTIMIPPSASSPGASPSPSG